MRQRCARLKGQLSEDLARRWLERRGLRTVARNYACRLGELDLIMQDEEHLVIVEVKYRGPGARVSGAESLTAAKQSRLVRAALHFLQGNPARQTQAVRFDLLSVTDSEAGRKFDWIRDAFQPRL